jgi:hypothetical protein
MSYHECSHDISYNKANFPTFVRYYNSYIINNVQFANESEELFRNLEAIDVDETYICTKVHLQNL